MSHLICACMQSGSGSKGRDVDIQSQDALAQLHCADRMASLIDADSGGCQVF